MTTHAPVTEGSVNPMPQASTVNSCASAKAASETPTGMVWQWPSFFLVQRLSSVDDPDAPEHPLVVAPNQAGVEFLFDFLEHVRSICIVLTTRDAQLRTEPVERLSLWRLSPDDRYLTALLCKSGAMFVVDSEQAYEVDEVTRKWIAAGKFKSCPSPYGAGAVSSTGS